MVARTLTMNDIADIVIGLLAAEAGIPPGQLKDELQADGPELPVNSLLVVEVLAKVEGACGVRIPVTEGVARSTRSVMTFARVIYRELAVKGDG